MPAPWNLGSAYLWCRNDCITVECLNLVHQVGVIPLGPAPWNSFSACSRAPREVHISDSAAYFTGEGQDDRTGACPACPVAPEDGTGVGSENRTGVESFLFLSCSMRSAPCPLSSALCHLSSALCVMLALPLWPGHS